MAVDVLAAEDVWDLDRKNSQFCLPWATLLLLCLYCATDVSTSLKLHVIFFTGSFPEPYLVALIRDGTIQAIDLATLHTTVVLSDLKDVYWYSNLAVDYVEKKLYFNHRRRIARANFDGTNMEIIPSQERIRTFALDGIGRRLFWVYYDSPRGVYVGSLDLKFKRRLLTHGPFILTLAVIPNEG